MFTHMISLEVRVSNACDEYACIHTVCAHTCTHMHIGMHACTHAGRHARMHIIHSAHTCMYTPELKRQYTYISSSTGTINQLIN